MFSDTSGSTAYKSQREIITSLVKIYRHNTEVEAEVDRQGGSVIKTLGDADGFSKFYAPLEEQRKQLEAEIPRLEAQVDILKVNNLSAEEIASQVLSAAVPS